jgi:hypothetical protein
MYQVLCKYISYICIQCIHTLRHTVFLLFVYTRGYLRVNGVMHIGYWWRSQKERDH